MRFLAVETCLFVVTRARTRRGNRRRVVFHRLVRPCMNVLSGHGGHDGFSGNLRKVLHRRWVFGNLEHDCIGGDLFRRLFAGPKEKRPLHA